LGNAIGVNPSSLPLILAGGHSGFPAWGRKSRGDRGQVRSCGQPWRQRDRNGASAGSDPPHPSRAARKPFLLRATLRAQVGSRRAQPGARKSSRHAKSRTFRHHPLIQNRDPFPAPISWPRFRPPRCRPGARHAV